MSKPHSLAYGLRTASGKAIRQSYIGTTRVLRTMLRTLGLLDVLERRPGRLARWLRSLFAIYDFDELSRLDLPWWTFDAIDIVEAYLSSHPGARVFEWGSGASTVWLGRRAGEVMSIEHDAEFGELVQHRMRDAAHVSIQIIRAEEHGQIRSSKPGYESQTFDKYAHAIADTEGRFDVIVIDGRAREACLAAAREKLAPGGIIVFDNAGRDRYRQAIEDSPFQVRMTSGLTACLPYPDATAILTAEGPITDD